MLIISYPAYFVENGALDMNMKFKNASACLVMMTALMGNTYAATSACPAVKNITQTSEDWGYSYKAADPSGQHWSGENPLATEADLESVHFTLAGIRNNDKGFFVACDYEGASDKGSKDAGFRLILKTPSEPKTVGSSWKDKECKAADPTLCTFE
ncbi:DUF3757 domain-containing protein [Pseudomonas syringae pv. syringae]|nr:DUF3757 domain-containing protein [Pseudomonas syringae pv. syringae]MCF5180291.1 DUF3757 domain-containing protein [Pseudomonas syringae]MCF5312753.1 DUF3757 domain-containing protein [Pseudomonas syringae]MCF5360414.1 DUF3757 domain-containing protein [Pseudomonas syringae]MCF5391029.1 DUF3757 domain-containing protein [Pseudomonas syringae]